MRILLISIAHWKIYKRKSVPAGTSWTILRREPSEAHKEVTPITARNARKEER
jgi:hypothetical protein